MIVKVILTSGFLLFIHLTPDTPLPNQLSPVTINKIEYLKQNKTSFDVLANIYPKDKSFDPKPGGDGQMSIASLEVRSLFA